MNQRIIYQTDGGISIIIPSQEALTTYTISQIADKDVPAGKPYAIIDASEIPTDRTFRTAWTVDEKLLKDGIGSVNNSFEE